MKIAAIRGVLGVLAWVPLPLLRALAWSLGLIPFVRRTERVRANLEKAFPELDPDARARLARRHRQAMLATALEAAPLWFRSRAWLERRWLAAEGEDVVDEALASGNGVLLVGGHFGHWEANILLYGMMDLPITILYKPPRDAEMDRELIAHRSRFGGDFAAVGQAAMRSAVRRLRQGEAVGLLFDQLPSAGQSVDAPFFGRTVPTMTLVWRLARRTGCRVVMAHVVRQPGGWQARFQPLAGVTDEADGSRAMARMNLALEREIRRNPEQYLWRYRRFDAINATDPAA
jgi:KDO2-lipid IV(A) lauroyltransferase